MLSSTEEAILTVTATNLGVSRDSLYNLINFESGWNPAAKNPNSSARGLIQFTDATAKLLGYKSSSDLVNKNKTITDQLPLVENYLSYYKPFATNQSLYMSVFYPAGRSWSETTVLPDSVRAANPGITTVGDYVAKVEGGTTTTIVKTSLVALPIIVIAIFLMMKGKN